jgi:hypothetical protein
METGRVLSSVPERRGAAGRAARGRSYGRTFGTEVTMSFDHATHNDVLLGNDEYRQLEQEHHDYERRLLAFSEKVVLSDDEQVEEITLKKKKLHVKDRMAAIARKIRGEDAHP